MKIDRFLCSLSGDEYRIITNCGEKQIKHRFVTIGFFVALIFLLCFISSYFTFTKLIKNDFVGVFIGLFFSMMITNIYLLLLYTLSKTTLVSNANRIAKYFSLGIRFVFIGFISLLISKPIETMIFSKSLKNDIIQFKKEQVAKYSESTQKYFDLETKNIKLIIERQKTSFASIDNLNRYEKLLDKKNQQKEDLIISMKKLVYSSNYFTYSIIVLNTRYPQCWLFTSVILFIFLFPAYLKHSLDEQSIYYNIRKEIESNLVIDEYTNFKKQYAQIHLDKFKMNLNVSELFIDPPFNTIRKVDQRKFLNEDDLISDLYNV
jgi:hypothetical protein